MRFLSYGLLLLSLTACSTKSDDGASGSNTCESAGGSCILHGTFTCGVNYSVADRNEFPCAATQGQDVVCCLPGNAGGASDTAANGNRVCATHGVYAGDPGQCGGTSCGAGCRCSLFFADRTTPEQYSCFCPAAPEEGVCVDVNCGTIFCGSDSAGTQLICRGGSTCSR